MISLRRHQVGPNPSCSAWVANQVSLRRSICAQLAREQRSTLRWTHATLRFCVFLGSWLQILMQDTQADPGLAHVMPSNRATAGPKICNAKTEPQMGVPNEFHRHASPPSHVCSLSQTSYQPEDARTGPAFCLGAFNLPWPKLTQSINF